MPTPFDWLYLALFALVLPLYDAFFGWPAYARRMRDDPVGARAWLWWSSTLQAWLLVALGAAHWALAGRPWTWLGFTMPGGWRLAAAIALLLAYAAYQWLAIRQLERDAALRDRARASVGAVADVVPHARRELRPFGAVALTAGFCEEFLYRGVFLWTLAPWLGWWGAAAVSTVCFAVGHAYQGPRGTLVTGIFGALYVAIVALTDSLWPAIALHVLVDATNGVIAWIILRGAGEARSET